MNPLRWPFRAQFFLGFLICAGLLGYAIFLQLKMGLEPCPLCIFQRLAFAALGLFVPDRCAARAVQPSRPRHLRRARLHRGGLGVGSAARHVYVQMLPPEMGATCGPPLSFLRETMGPLEVFPHVLTGTGNCGNIDWTFLADHGRCGRACGSCCWRCGTGGVAAQVKR